MTIPAYPLQWPAGWKRTRAPDRAPAKFGVKRTRYSSYTQPDGSRGSWQAKENITIAEAVKRVRAELERMGIADDDVVISSDLQLRLDGLPRSSQREPDDPGAAVYWTDRFDTTRPPRCMAIDRYDRVADNLAAIAATLDAMRAIERHGGAEILNRAFTGFVALEGPGPEHWSTVLGVPSDAARDAIDLAYRQMRSIHHPDRGGTTEQFQRIQRAYLQAIQ